MSQLRIIAAALVFAGAASAAQAPVEPPRISKPRPAPPGPVTVTTLPPAVFDPTLNVGGTNVKARLVDTRLSVEVQINGRGPYHFIVDSGADTSAVALGVARQLQLPLGPPAVLNASTARSIVDRVKVDQLTIGSSTVENLELPALREVDLGGDGLIGIDALAQQRLMMDFERRYIKVEDARIKEKREPNEILIIARRQRGQLILTHVKAGGYDLDAVIDTGTQVTIGNTALRDKLVRRGGGKLVTLPVIGVTGETMNLQVIQVPELRIGPVVLHDVPIAFGDLPPFKLFGLADQPALLLGTDILENFRRLSLDFRSRRVRFQLRRCDAQPTIEAMHDSFNYMTRIASIDGQVCAR